MKKLMDYLEAAHEQRDGKWGTWIGLSELKQIPSFNEIEKMGFKLISTDRQLKNGSLVFKSKVGEEDYEDTEFTITAAGYVRREYMNRYGYFVRGRKERYPLNRNESWYGKPIESMEDLKVALDWLAAFLKRNPHRHEPEARDKYNKREEELRQKRLSAHGSGKKYPPLKRTK